MFDNLLQDLRYALRSLRKNPVFTVVAVLTLGVGIGANTAVFSVVNGVLLRPLPYEEPDQLAVLWTNFGEDLPQNWVSGPEYLDLREHNTAFEEIAVLSTDSGALTGDGDPEQVSVATVSGGFFEMLRVRPQMGRLLAPTDDIDGGAAVVVVADGFWRRRLGSDPDAVGSKLVLDGEPFTVIGVLEPDFAIHHPNISNPAGLDIWAPLQPTYHTSYASLGRGSHFLLGFGRMRAGVDVAQAQADLDAVATKMADLYPNSYVFDGWGLTAYSLHDDLVEGSRGGLAMLLGAVGFVLLIACVNVANLQLTRAVIRGREMALRTALGAGRRRLLQQLLTESLVLAGLGAVVGICLAFWMVRALLLVAPAGLPRVDAAGLDASVLLFAAALTLVTAILFGAAPGLFASRARLADSLKDGNRTSAAAAGGRARGALVVAEVALALVLLVGAGLMLRSFSELLRTDPDYDTESLLTMRVALPQSQYEEESAAVLWDQLLERIRAFPEVVEAGATSALPLSGYGGSGTTFAEESSGVELSPNAPFPFIEADRRWVTPTFFAASGMRLLRGRLFSQADSSDAAPVAVVDNEFARRFWGEQDPLGQRVTIKFSADEETGSMIPVWSEVVGVVQHARQRGIDRVGREQLYLPALQTPRFAMHLVVRTSGDPAAVTAAVRRELSALDVSLPISDLQTMQERVARSVAGPRFQSILLGAFGAAALLLAAIGFYGVIAFSVGQRTNEIGVRMALGADSGSVPSLVLRQAMLLVAIGLGLGLLAAFGLTRLLTDLLYSVSPSDPLTYAVVAALLSAVALFASWVPAARATRVQPVAALRDE